MEPQMFAVEFLINKNVQRLIIFTRKIPNDIVTTGISISYVVVLSNYIPVAMRRNATLLCNYE